MWFTLKRKGVSDNMECIKKMFHDTKFCVKCGGDEVTDFIEERRGVRQGCSLSPCVFNIFLDDVID
jgi:hypothetical protein